MNYLAHLYFAHQTKTSLLGGILPDFMKGNAHKAFDSDVVEGIQLHRQIDKFTDTHAIVRLSKSRISIDRRRFSGVLTDVFYDHFLAKNWHRFSKTDFSCQIDRWYRKLTAACDAQIPERLKIAISRMRRYDLLKSYETIDGIDYAVNRISTQLSFKNNLHGGVDELLINYQGIEKDFINFFPRLSEYVEASRR